jgi:hypothetical protein
MKKLLLLLLFAAPMFGFAQVTTPSPQQKGPFYIAEVYRGLSNCEVSIDDGSGKKVKNMMIKDAQGKTMKFNSVVSVINYLAQNGWSIITSYEDTLGGATPSVALVIKRS